MPVNLKKFRQRLMLLSISAAYNLIPMAFNMAMAALVVRLLNAALWGDMVELFLWTGIAGNVMAWGNKDYLLRNFSLSPAALDIEWQKSFGSRSLIFAFILFVLVFLPLTATVKGMVAIYLLTRFIYMSYDSLVVYSKRFIATIAFETLGFGVVACSIYFYRPAEMETLLSYFIIAESLKMVGIILLFRKDVMPLLFSKIELSYFPTAFSFFILYFSGMLASRVDLICSTRFLDEISLARYQVLMNFIQATQLSIPILLLPYITIIYRMKITSIKKMALRLLMVGMLIAAVAIFAISVLVQLIFDFQYEPLIFLLGWLIVVPGFYYAPLIYRLFRNNRQHVVVVVSLLFITCSVALIFLFTSFLPDPFIAIFMAMALAQWIQGGVYFYFRKGLI